MPSPAAAIVDLLLCSLAIWGFVEAVHHGSIFDRLRGWLEAREGFIADAVSCPYCFSHWVGMIVAVLAVASHLREYGLIEIVCIPPYLVLLWIASVRLANTFNDVTHSLCRTPREDLPPFDVKDDDEQ